MRLSKKIILASTNPHKLHEFERLLRPYTDLELVPANRILRNADKLGSAEIHLTYLENSAAKARLVNQGCHYPALSDDTGLEVHALNLSPGVKSFRYATLSDRNPTRSAQDAANREKLLKELQSLGPSSSREARFVTTVCLCIEGVLLYGTGTLEGTIAEAPRGSHGFGYDSIFIPKGHQRTLAEMTDEEKNQISHRAKAVHDLTSQMQIKGIVLAKP